MIWPRQGQDARQVAGHYDELDAFYRGLWGEHLHHGLWSSGDETPERAVRQLVDLVAAAAHVRAGAAVCDVGCGYGATCRLLAQRGASVTGLTISRAQYEYARNADGAGPAAVPPGDQARGEDPPAVARLPATAAGGTVAGSAWARGQCTYELGDWLDNGLRDASFDAVVAIESLSHMADKPRAFAECARVLRPGGRLVICDWMAGERPRRGQVRWLLEPICREGRLASMATESEYRALLGQVGLSAVSGRELTGQVRRTWGICLQRVGRRLAHDSEARRYLRDASRAERGFLLAMARIPLAYRTGAMRYVLLVAVKPGG